LITPKRVEGGWLLFGNLRRIQRRPAFAPYAGRDRPTVRNTSALPALKLPAARRSGGNARMSRFIPASRLGEQPGRARMILEQSCMRCDIVRRPKPRPVGGGQFQRRNVERAGEICALS